MINASNFLVHTPGGQLSAGKHPESHQRILYHESFEISQVSQSSMTVELDNLRSKWTSSDNFWCSRCDGQGKEEELYCSGKLAFHSDGSQPESASQICYSCDTNVAHGIWCKFSDHDQYKTTGCTSMNLQESTDRTVNCVCLLDSYTMNIFTEYGESYSSTLLCKVSAVWPTKYGILLENSTSPDSHGVTSPNHTGNITTIEEINVPKLYSLTHPLHDIHPVLLKHGNTFTIPGINLRIIYANSEPSFVFTFNEKTGLHSIFKLRSCSIEERQYVNAYPDYFSSSYNSIPSTSFNYAANNSTEVKNNVMKICCSKTGFSSSPHPSKMISDLSNRSVNLSPMLQLFPRPHSPMAAMSRCQSPSNPRFCNSFIESYSQSNKSHQSPSIFPSELFGSDCSITTNENFHCHARGITEPELCLDHVWTENIGTVRGNIDCASKVFITKDFIGQTYFCYLMQNQGRLNVMRFEKSNDNDQIIFGSATIMEAKDAVDIPELKMMATTDFQGNTLLHSGLSYVGKLHFPNIHSNIAKTCHKLSSIHELQIPPYPRRSSLISSDLSLLEAGFDEGVHLLSPVSGIISHIHIMNHSLRDGLSMHLNTAASNKLILSDGYSKYYTITLPSSKTSPLVHRCLETLRNILSRDSAMLLLIKWYVARNAPGPEDLSPDQEWNLFLVLFFTLLSYDVNKLQIIISSYSDHRSENLSPVAVSKKQKTVRRGAIEDWSYLISSGITQEVVFFFHEALGFRDWNHNSAVTNIGYENIEINKVDTHTTFIAFLPHILFSLHLLYEEIKMNTNMSSSLFSLAKLLHQLSNDLNLNDYKQHYYSDFPALRGNLSRFRIDDMEGLQTILYNFTPDQPPDIHRSLYNILVSLDTPPYPSIVQVNPMSKNLIQLFSMFKGSKYCNIVHLDSFFKIFDYPTNDERQYTEKSSTKILENIIIYCSEKGFTKRELDNLPPSFNYIVNNIMHQCKETPPSCWSPLVFSLIDRQDLSNLGQETLVNPSQNNEYNCFSTGCKSNARGVSDGMDFDNTILRMRFNSDHRVKEIRKLLNSSEAMEISIFQRPDVSDHEFIEEQEKCLYALCTRTMSLPIGRGMFTLRTATPINTEQLQIPQLCLTGKAPPRGTLIELTHIDVPTNMNLWPLFHNGVATGLCIHPEASNVDSTWIVYNKQHQSEIEIEHSGFLMALGLNGHLKNLAPFSMYEYLVECHETTSVGLLLGLSATHQSSMNVSMTKLLSLHVETLLPPTSVELNVQQNVQIAALLGVGLVYLGTNHRHIANALLSEIGRPPGPEMKNCVDRESYSLTAGLALGLVVLNSGGGSDLTNISDTLHYYMLGGNIRPFSGTQKDKYKSPSYQIREGDSINIDVTSPGATMALGLMYLRSGNYAIAEWMKVPNTQYLLDFVRPDLLLLRILAKSLILWEEIQPSKTWISSHIPHIVSKYRLQKPPIDISRHIDLETVNQVYCNIIAGACMAVGLKYAGSGNPMAFKTLYHFLKMFMMLSNKSIAELAGRATLETCLNVVLLSTSIVMAGTGNLQVLRMCRYLRTRVGPKNAVVTYGSHQATHMALGFLFLGGGSYTFSNDSSSVAALIISLFPKFPTHSNDNRYHLQALRHFYVLAAQPRLLLPRDIDNHKNCYANVRITLLSQNQEEGEKITMKAPCLLPQLDKLYKVELDDDRYWKITFDKERNFDSLKKILETNGILNVKQKAGCFSHIDDPQGFRSLLAQTLTTEEVIVWTAYLEQILSFTSDDVIINFIRIFVLKTDFTHKRKNISSCLNRVQDSHALLYFTFTDHREDSDNQNQIREILQTTSSVEIHTSQILITMSYECVVRDKMNFLPLWLNIQEALSTVYRQVRIRIIWQMKFLYAFKIRLEYFQGHRSLLDAENILAHKQRLCSTFDSWENGTLNIMNDARNMNNHLGNSEKLMCYVFNDNEFQSFNRLITNIQDNCIIKRNLSCMEIYGISKYSIREMNDACRMFLNYEINYHHST